MTDEEIYNEIVDTQKGSGESLSHLFTLYGSTNGIGQYQVQAAYYRHKKIIDSEASVSDPKPLRDGTEGDSIAALLATAEDLVVQFNDVVNRLGYAFDQLEVQAAGTERMTKLAEFLKLDC